MQDREDCVCQNPEAGCETNSVIESDCHTLDDSSISIGKINVCSQEASLRQGLKDARDQSIVGLKDTSIEEMRCTREHGLKNASGQDYSGSVHHLKSVQDGLKDTSKRMLECAYGCSSSCVRKPHGVANKAPTFEQIQQVG